MPRVEDVFNTGAILDYTNNLDRQPVLGDALFPERKIDDIEFGIVKGGNNLPVAASVHAWDSEAEIAGRDGFEIAKAELALIKRKIRLAEKEIIKIQNPRTNQELTNVLNTLFDDAAKMEEAVRTRANAMRFEVLTTGKLSFNENGYTGEIDYKVPAGHKEEVETPWTSSEADILGDLQKWQDKIYADTGVRPIRALTSLRVARLAQANANIQAAVYGTNAVGRRVSLPQLNALLQAEGLPTLATEEGQYRTQKADGTYTTHRYVPEDALVIFPEGDLGELIYGVTAEELELQNDGSVDMNAVGNVVMTVSRTSDPVSRWTKATAVALPSFPMADQVFIATGLTAEVPEEPEGA